MSRHDYEPTVEEIEAQVERLISRNEEAFYMFDGATTADTDRQPSEYFGQISSLELRQLQYNPDATAEQHKAAGMELRRRLIDAEQELLETMAEAAAEKEAKESWSELSTSQRTSVQAAMARAGSGAWQS